jgi:hypothetical protein
MEVIELVQGATFVEAGYVYTKDAAVVKQEV